MSNPFTVNFPPDLFASAIWALRRAEKSIKAEATEENLAISAVMLSDIQQIKRVMRGLDRWDESQDHRLDEMRKM
jgi:hypothetical protein